MINGSGVVIALIRGRELIREFLTTALSLQKGQTPCGV